MSHVTFLSVRQLGLDETSTIAQTVSKAAEGYLRDDSRSPKSENKQIVLELVLGLIPEEDEKEIFEEVLRELEVCVVSYFSFHWQHAASFIEKVSSIS